MKYLVSVLMILGLAACGPEDSNLDKETQEMNRLYQKNKEIMEALAGDYSGTGTNTSGEKMVVDLHLRSFSVFTPNLNRIELIEIPNMLGFMNYGTSGNVALNFSQGNFDHRTQTLRLSGTGEAGDFYFMALTLKGDMLNGELLRRRLTSQVSLKKIND